MKRLFILFSCTIMLLSACGKQDSPSNSDVTATEGSSSQEQSNVSTPENNDMQTRQVLIKRTKYDETDNVLGWREYTYDSENQAEWREYDADGKSLGHGIEKYDSDWNLIEYSEYNEFDVMIMQEKYNEIGDMIYCAYYSENGTLETQLEYSYTYNDNDNGTLDFQTYHSKLDYGESEYIITQIYDENGAPQREERERLDSGTKYNSKLYSCDENNRILEERRYFSSGNLLNKYSYQYDEQGRIIEERCEDDLPDYNFTRTYNYDEQGNCITQQTTYPIAHEKNSLITSTYDENGFILQETHEENDGTWYYCYEYDMIPVSDK